MAVIFEIKDLFIGADKSCGVGFEVVASIASVVLVSEMGLRPFIKQVGLASLFNSVFVQELLTREVLCRKVVGGCLWGVVVVGGLVP